MRRSIHKRETYAAFDVHQHAHETLDTCFARPEKSSFLVIVDAVSYAVHGLVRLHGSCCCFKSLPQASIVGVRFAEFESGPSHVLGC